MGRTDCRRERTRLGTPLLRLGTPGRWRAVDESSAVLDIILQPHRNSDAARTFFERLLVNYDVPNIIHTDKL